MSGKIHLVINEAKFARGKALAKQIAKDKLGSNVDLVFDEELFSTDTKLVDLTVDGELCITGKADYIGDIHLDIPLDMDLVVKIIELYRKKLGKLKTVLEATK